MTVSGHAAGQTQSQQGRGRRVLAWVLRGLLAAFGLSPFFPVLTARVWWLRWLGDGVEYWFAYQCHRDPARTLYVFGQALPVCSRCLGIYVGLGLGALVLYPRLGVWALRLWVGTAATLMVVDVATEALALRPPWALMRVLTGLLLAYPVGNALVRAAEGIHAQAEQRTP